MEDKKDEQLKKRRGRPIGWRKDKSKVLMNPQRGTIQIPQNQLINKDAERIMKQQGGGFKIPGKRRGPRKNNLETVNESLTERSGTYGTDDMLVRFLYVLMRDRIPAGHIEKAMIDAAEGGPGSVTLCNGWMAKYAHDLAERIRGKQ